LIPPRYRRLIIGLAIIVAFDVVIAVVVLIALALGSD